MSAPFVLAKCLEVFGTPPDFRFVDTMVIAYRKGLMRQDEQREAFIAAARAATDGLSFLSALANFGVNRHSELYALVEKIQAAPAYYQSTQKHLLGLRLEGVTPRPFLQDEKVLFLVEPVLNSTQFKLFEKTFWQFSDQHRPVVMKPNGQHSIGLYVNEPRDNASVLPRFAAYLDHLMHHASQREQEQFEGFPADIVMALLWRAYM